MSLTAGFGRRCITPEESVPLAGYGNTLHGYLAEDKAFDVGCYEVDFRRYPQRNGRKNGRSFCEYD